ncbi:uncharacterized protein G2W53_041862 [Senna tora]|uniref:Uncharacterized protein n=1 Tax=Senna tora TaxID=362788 RepID=A0A834SGD5_9FABA|nr:uncharacterized protein G2W53_041862 [Senna tora]
MGGRRWRCPIRGREGGLGGPSLLLRRLLMSMGPTRMGKGRDMSIS